MTVKIRFMKNALRPGTTDEYETTACFLENLAQHTDNDQERQECLAVARSFRVEARRTASHRRLRGKEQPNPVRRKPSTGGQHG